MKKIAPLLAVVLVHIFLVGSVIKFTGPTLVSSVGKYVTYTFRTPAVNISLPEGTSITEKFLGKNEILLSSQLRDPQLNLRGYIQVWDLGNLEAFLAGSRQTSSLNYNAYSIRKIKIQRREGYIVEWSANFGRFYAISAKEFWLKKDNGRQVLRVSFFVDQPQFPKPLEQVVNTIMASLNWK